MIMLNTFLMIRENPTQQDILKIQAEMTVIKLSMLWLKVFSTTINLENFMEIRSKILDFVKRSYLINNLSELAANLKNQKNRN